MCARDQPDQRLHAAPVRRGTCRETDARSARSLSGWTSHLFGNSRGNSAGRKADRIRSGDQPAPPAQAGAQRFGSSCEAAPKALNGGEVLSWCDRNIIPEMKVLCEPSVTKLLVTIACNKGYPDCVSWAIG